MTTREAPTVEARGGVIRSLRGLLPLGAVLVVPFLLRPRDSLVSESGETVVILTPHAEPVRYEFGRAFREHMHEKGRDVRVDWRTPGSSSEITRIVIGEFTTAFENHWRRTLGRPWTARIGAAFANPSIANAAVEVTADEKTARSVFLESNVGIGIDLLFGAGSVEAAAHARAGRLVDAGVVTRHPELFGESGVPQMTGGKVLWDKEGRWMGTCLTTFGICYNRDAVARLGVGKPAQWADLTKAAFYGQLALADPSKSGAVATAFEMVVHQQMNLRWQELTEDARQNEGAAQTDQDKAADIDLRARRDGWERGMRLIRRIAGNGRYFGMLGTRTPLDVAMGDAAAGMCIDFYGRFQSELANRKSERTGFVTPHGGSAIDTDPIGLFRGAPHRELATEFIEFVLSAEGQKLWAFRVGTPGGPVRQALRRLPIAPALYAPPLDALRADQGENPYDEARSFTYHAAWTSPLFRTIAYVVRVTCVDPHEELRAAYGALIDAHFPPHATALFDDVGLIDYDAAVGPLRKAVASSDPLEEAAMTRRLLLAVREQYRRVVQLAAKGE